MKNTLRIFNFTIKLFVILIFIHFILKFFTIQEGLGNFKLLKMEKKYIKKKFRKDKEKISIKKKISINIKDVW